MKRTKVDASKVAVDDASDGEVNKLLLLRRLDDLAECGVKLCARLLHTRDPVLEDMLQQREAVWHAACWLLSWRQDAGTSIAGAAPFGTEDRLYLGVLQTRLQEWLGTLAKLQSDVYQEVASLVPGGATAETRHQAPFSVREAMLTLVACLADRVGNFVSDVEHLTEKATNGDAWPKSLKILRSAFAWVCVLYSEECLHVLRLSDVTPSTFDVPALMYKYVDLAGASERVCHKLSDSAGLSMRALVDLQNLMTVLPPWMWRLTRTEGVRSCHFPGLVFAEDSSDVEFSLEDLATMVGEATKEVTALEVVRLPCDGKDELCLTLEQGVREHALRLLHAALAVTDLLRSTEGYEVTSPLVRRLAEANKYAYQLVHAMWGKDFMDVMNRLFDEATCDGVSPLLRPI
jgi:hypothetical protein